MTTWILVSDAGSARVFAATKWREPWRVVQEIDNPDGRAREAELVSDHPGRQSGAAASPSMKAPASAKTREAERFAARLARLVERGYDDHAFDRLVLVAPPRFLGRLRQKIRASVQASIAAQIRHDYTHAGAAEVEERVRPLVGAR